jgi:plastocyanin
MCPLPRGLRNRFLSLALLWLSATAAAATKHVQVGNIFFRDVESGTSTTTINVGDTVEWDWVQDGGTHTTTSGTCSGVSCTPDDATWNNPVDPDHTVFSRTFNTPGVFPYFCVPHQAFMQGTVIVTADFTVDVSDADGGSTGPIFPGQQAVFDGMVVGSTGYNKTVTLSCQSGTPTLPSPCTPDPLSGIPTGTPTPTFNFTITAGANSTGHYSFSAQGTDGALTHFFPNLNFDVVDFGMAAPLPASVTAFSDPASASTSSSASVTLTAVGSLPNAVSLSCESNSASDPSCTTAFYSPVDGAPVSAPVSLSVPANKPVQDYNVILDATSSTSAGPPVTKNQTLVLHVVQFNAASFAPGAVTIGAGNVSNPATTQLTTNGTFVNPVTATMACTAGLPAGGACSFSPNHGVVTGFPSGQSVVVSVPFNTPAANPNLTITATANSGEVMFVQSQSLTLHIPAPSLSLSTPSPVTMVNNSFSPPVTVQITPTNLAGTVSLSCGSLPANVFCHFLPSATVKVNGGPMTFAVVFEAKGATPGPPATININANATINSLPVSTSVSPQLTINAPGATTDVSLGVTAINTITNSSKLINVGDPNLKITASVNNIGGSTYSSPTWEIGFSNPVILLPASVTNATCSQLSPTAISCSLSDVASGGSSSPSFNVAPQSGRSLDINNWLTSATTGDSNLNDNSATPPTVQVRPRPLARRGLVPKTP